MLPRNRKPTHPGEMLLEAYPQFWMNLQTNYDLYLAGQDLEDAA